MIAQGNEITITDKALTKAYDLMGESNILGAEYFCALALKVADVRVLLMNWISTMKVNLAICNLEMSG